MTNAAGRQVDRIALARPVLYRAGAVGEHIRAVLARVQALRGFSSGLGVPTLPIAVRRPAMAGSAADYRANLLARLGSVGGDAVARRAGGTPAVLISSARIVGARKDGVGVATYARARGVVIGPSVIVPRMAAALSQPTADVIAGPRLAALAGVSLGGSGRIAAFSARDKLVRARHVIAAPMAERTAAPGFHRTVRQPQAKAAAGNVYLDKTLVGYHLAAAITAEQTRAAARPNVSGASFNSSMATLRPSGASL